MPRKPTGRPNGRPPAAEPHRRTIPVRLSDRQCELLDEAARLQGVTRAEIIRAAAIASATRYLAASKRR